MIDTILWDADGTLLDFEAAEKKSILQCLEKQGLTATDEQVDRYKSINIRYWKEFEKGNITKEELYPGRFVEWFDEMGVEGDPIKMNDDYQIALGDNPVPMPDALAVLKLLKEEYRQYIVTNGSTIAQTGKLDKTGIVRIMNGVFISEEIGEPKPSIKYFEECKKRIPDYDSRKTVIIGDSLSSDMKGGNNAGIKCIWFNPNNEKAPDDIKIDAIVRTLSEIPQVLKAL